MKKTACVVWLVLYALIAVAVGLGVHHRVRSVEGAIAAAIFGGGATWLGIAYILGIGEKRREAKMIRSAMSGERPKDGEKIAAVGTVMSAGGGSLEAPFSRTPCVAYEYKIVDRSGEGESVRYSGCALSPSMIQSARGSVRLLAWPDLDFPTEDVSNEEGYQNATAYLATLPKESTRPGGIGAAIQEFKRLAADDDGSIRSDIGDAQSDFNIHQMRLTEKVLKAGERVCATGTYSAAKGGLVPAPGTFAIPVKITKGDGDAMLRKITRSYFTNFTCGLILLAGVTIAAGAFLLMIPLEAAEQINPERPILWAEIKLERFLDQRVKTPLVSAGVLQKDESFTSTNLSRGVARGVLEVGDERVELVLVDASRAAESVNVRLTDSTDQKGVEVGIRSGTVRSVALIGYPALRGLESRTSAELFESTYEAQGRLTILDDAVRCRVTFYTAIE